MYIELAAGVILLERQLTPNCSLGSDSSGISSRVLDYLRSIPLGSHAIFFYENQQEIVQAFNSYLKGGLERDEPVHLIAPNHDAYADFLQSTDVDVESLEKDNRLGCMSISDFLTDKGRLSSAKALQSATKLIEEDRELGFRGTRTITPSTEQNYLEYGSPSDLLRYEQGLGPNFNLPITAFCTYSSGRLVGLGLQELLISLFQPHGTIIAKGLAWAKG